MIKIFDNVEYLPKNLELGHNDVLIVKVDLEKYDLNELEQWLKVWEKFFPDNTIMLAPIDVDFLTISKK